ncbi:exopolysaccharide Pel transporter PelG [Brevibacillus centrosporus]|uniref:exopolysaccharide Pel transporter PelG n=2 Tax=Brevibacillus centrosporus TaxID=54910 RepID=UPI002E1F58BD|nr:exopolysaccharide Pel transporter PelG [Brevibacillus centrosporus]
MAGIGFELKKMFRGRGYLSGMKAYAYSSLVTVGPMALCMLMVTLLQQLLIYLDVSYLERMTFLAAVVYAFVFSLLVTCGFIMVISRYIADKIYLREYDEIIASLYGVIATCLGLGGVAGAVFYYFSPLDAVFKISAYLLYVELIVVWLQSAYMSALKDYMRIIRGYAAAVIVTGLSALLMVYAAGMHTGLAMLISMNIGFFVMIALSFLHLESYFRQKANQYFAFLQYVKKYPSLLATGLFCSLGFYIHNFIYWLMSPLQENIADTYWIASSYDVPAFYASLSFLPTMVMFVVSVETAFYEKYRQYYGTILGTGSVQDIKRAKKDMIQTLMQELGFMMEIQLFFTFVSLALGITLLPHIGFSTEQIERFNILVVAGFLYAVMFVLMLLLLYFDDRRGAALVTALFVTSTAVITLAMLPLENYGFSFFLSSFLAVAAALGRLLYYLKNIDYYTYCSQPLIAREER